MASIGSGCQSRAADTDGSSSMRHIFSGLATSRARWFLLSAVLLGTSGFAQELSIQEAGAMVAVARTFITDTLAERVQSMGGTLHVNVSPPPARQHLAACNQMQAYHPPGAHSTGRTLVGVRCLAPYPWQVFLSAEVHAEAPVWVAAQPLSAGHQITPSDLIARNMEIAIDGPAARLMPAIDARVVGQTLGRSLPESGALRSDDLVDPARLNPGDAIEVVYVGSGFRVSSEGKTIGAASPGQTVQVRMASGMVVTGTLNDEHVVELHL
jgi:flagellar basal body P-ring formation protein FlgA